MHFSIPTIMAFAIPTLAQSFTVNPSATITSNGVIGPPWATSNPEWSSIYDSLVSDGKIPSTLTAAPWPTTGWGPGRGPWGGGAWGTNSPDKPWGGPSGYGPWGSGKGPWSEWSTNSAWRNGPWTAWWGGSACPPTDWPGWTAGPWSTSAPWTTWAGCTASTTTTELVTSTVSGSVVTATAYGLQVAAVSAEATSPSTGGAPMQTVGMGAAIGAAVLGVVGVL